MDAARDLPRLAPELALIATMLGIVAAPILLGRGARTIAAVAAVGIATAIWMVIRTAGMVEANGPMSALTPDPNGGMIVVDSIAVFYKFLLLIFLAGVTYLWWIGSADQERDAPEFFILLIGSALGMALMAGTTNLLMMAVAIETASLPSYAIVGFNKRDAKAAEASLKYMVFGAISAAAMLYGISLIYGLTGSLEMATVAPAVIDALSGGNALLTGIALLLILAGVAFKISAVPFHFWCPDAFEGAKIEVTTWLSVASKAAGLLLLWRLVNAFCSAVPTPQAMTVIRPLAWGIGIMAIITATWANFAAYQQTSVKRLLAYSSIAHAGYMLMAVAVLIHPDDLLIDLSFRELGSFPHPGVSALLAYLVIYLFMNLGAFGVVALVNWDCGNDNIESFNGLIRRAPVLAVSLVLCLVSMVGLPPLAGFVGKWWILVALAEQAADPISRAALTMPDGQIVNTLGWTLITAAVLNTLFSLYYYMRLVVEMTLKDDGRPRVGAPLGGTVLAGACASLLIVLFVLVGPLKTQTDKYATRPFDPTRVTRVAGDAPPALASTADSP